MAGRVAITAACRSDMASSDVMDVDADPALRILGAHGRMLETVAPEAYRRGRLQELDPRRVGLFFGMGMVDGADDLVAAADASRVDGRIDEARFFAGAYRSIHPLWPLAMLNNVAAGQIATDLGIRGDNAVLASESDAGMRALIEAHHAIDEGAAQAALCAGVSEDLTTPARLRDALRGEPAEREQAGAACVLESEASAKDRGVAALAFVVAGTSTFEYGSGDACTRAIRTVLRERDPQSVGHVRAPLDLWFELQAYGLADALVEQRGAVRSSRGAAEPLVDLVACVDHFHATGAGSALVLTRASHGGCAAILLESP